MTELAALRDAFSQALKDSRDDRWLRSNELYRRSAAVCLYRRELSGETMFSGVAAVTSFISMRVWHDGKQVLFSPEDVRALARAIAELESRAGGMDRVLSLRDAIHGLETQRGGEDAVIAELRGRTEAQAKLAPGAYRSFKRALGGTIRRRAALAILVMIVSIRPGPERIGDGHSAQHDACDDNGRSHDSLHWLGPGRALRASYHSMETPLVSARSGARTCRARSRM